ncbi:MAG: prolyl oligopeptidase family serine peptidase [Acidobacteriota bacterium]|nr:prolyl oligopeptidase family serine peptidase [Acidobacteriota bacterium]
MRNLCGNRRIAVTAICLLLCVGWAAAATEKKPLTFEDMMRFRSIVRPAISEDGAWVAYAAQPDRGDGEAVVRNTRNEKTFVIPRGTNPVLSKNGLWAAAVVSPPAVEIEKAAKDRPKPGLALINLTTGEMSAWERVEDFSFSDDSRWIGFRIFPEERKDKPEASAPAEKDSKRDSGRTLVLRRLADGEEIRIDDVASYSFAPDSGRLVYAVAKTGGKDNGLIARDLAAAASSETRLHASDGTVYRNLSWTRDGARLAFLAGAQDDGGRIEACNLYIWATGGASSPEPAVKAGLPKDWIFPAVNEISWTRDGKRLFVGLRPGGKPEDPERPEGGKKEDGEALLFDKATILEKREVDVWHWNDPLIVTHQKKIWPRLKDRTFRAVWHLETRRLVPLAGEDMPEVLTSENPRVALGLSPVPYLKEVTWDGNYQDVYVLDLSDGRRTKIVERLESRPSLSPGGRYAVYYAKGQWHLHDVRSGRTRDLTSALDVPFANEDHDTPAEPRGYGTAGWAADDSAVLIYDKFDIWRFATADGRAVNLTEGAGRRDRTVFRVLRLDSESPGFAKGERLLLSTYHDHEKHYGFASLRADSPGFEVLLEEKKKFQFLLKAKNAERILYTREDYGEFPDLWTAGTDLSDPRRLSDINPQIVEFAWGSAELVEWASLDGRPLQGVLIKPENGEPGRRLPVIVYYYELFSQRLHEFNPVVVNHRPNFPFYASNGYAIFLPDVRYDRGLPGMSAVKCVVPGVQKIIDMGVADPAAIALHGHSWSGYQTAFVVTQTDIFACAVAGAPVSNMTSAYSGIRWESGLARQFQYEKAQSRIGATLWEAPLLYIENSPVFYADRIRTPLLLMFGDVDGAVPWEQGIEMYMAMRRLGKDCIFLQYRGEPHHPQKYANKLDYSIKMKEYFDYYLKGKPAADWIVKGVPYTGK